MWRAILILVGALPVISQTVSNVETQCASTGPACAKGLQCVGGICVSKDCQSDADCPEKDYYCTKTGSKPGSCQLGCRLNDQNACSIGTPCIVADGNQIGSCPVCDVWLNETLMRLWDPSFPALHKQPPPAGPTTYACCTDTGNTVCQDSSCVVAGFANSARANCVISYDKDDGFATKCTALGGGDKNNAHGSFCEWYHGSTCTVPHCWGNVACQNSTGHKVEGANCYAKGRFCLEDGTSQKDMEDHKYNFKICHDAAASRITCSGDDSATTPAQWDVTMKDDMVLDELSCLVTDAGDFTVTTLDIGDASCTIGGQSVSVALPYFFGSSDLICTFTHNFSSSSGGSVICSMTGSGQPVETDPSTCIFGTLPPPPPPDGDWNCSIVEGSLVLSEPSYGQAGSLTTATIDKQAKFHVAISSAPPSSVSVTCILGTVYNQTVATGGAVRTFTFSGFYADNYADIICTATYEGVSKTCSTDIRVEDTMPPTCDEPAWDGWLDIVETPTEAYNLNWLVKFTDDEDLKAWECTAEHINPEPKVITVYQAGTTLLAHSAAGAAPVDSPYNRSLEADFPLGLSRVTCQVSDIPVQYTTQMNLTEIDKSADSECIQDIKVCHKKSVLLIAGQHCPIGQVDVKFVNERIFVMYEIDQPNCTLEEVHVEINAGPVPVIPATPGQFDAQQQYQQATSAIVSLSLEEAMAGSCLPEPTAVLELSIMAHGVAKCTVPVTSADGHVCFDTSDKSETLYGQGNRVSNLTDPALKSSSNWATYFNYYASCPCGLDTSAPTCSAADREATVWSDWTGCNAACGPMREYQWAKDTADALKCPPNSRLCDIPDCKDCQGVHVDELSLKGTGDVEYAKIDFAFDQLALKFILNAKAGTNFNLKSVKVDFQPTKVNPQPGDAVIPYTSFTQNQLNVPSTVLVIPAEKVMVHCDFAVNLNFGIYVTVQTNPRKGKATIMPMVTFKPSPLDTLLLCRCLNNNTGEFMQGWAAEVPQTTASTPSTCSEPSTSGWVWGIVGAAAGLTAGLVLAAGCFVCWRQRLVPKETVFDVSFDHQAGAPGLFSTPNLSSPANSGYHPMCQKDNAPYPSPTPNAIQV